ncbi:sigma-54 dependent transcriptional regulator [Vibrio sp. J1-1]|uniref:sigma-54-dependent transcriptional regulator n=1 Tax=Vibrio sp. J1-1 TaxID=2912251 RepID=UPI001E12B90B|nr:sigma-54 dependent transcriptional regulator [Vibrio sp. J1-1]MBR9787403.1 sigma-54-dependent Fis family transcriptional regulator [Vibrionaceae bacterium]MCF7483497.1 sigma-54 dependent transcriptional regulator [Vibrio sp. J1-1]
MRNNPYSVLLVDDDQDVLDSYSYLMNISSIKSKEINDPTQATQYLTPEWAGVVILDMYMPQMHGLELLRMIKNIDERIPVIVITGHGDIPMAVDAVKQGACEFLEKPINPPELLALVKQQLKIRANQVESQLQAEKSISRSLIGKSAHMEQLRKLVAQYALLDTHIVVYGESGTGRHRVAGLIKDMMSQNKETEFNTLSLSSTSTKACIDEATNSQGTLVLVLENLPELAEDEQRHLAQVLLTRERCGKKNLRVMTIFDSEPEEYITKNQLLPELYYLLNQGVIHVPPLKQHPDDIVTIFHHFLKLSCKKLGKPLPSVDTSYLALLRNYPWPGNIRELRNIAELYSIGIVKLTGKERIYSQNEIQLPLDELVDDFEKQLIEDALFLHSGRVTDAASHLQIPRKKLYLRMKKHGIEKDNYKPR